jgi:hypothetical protein
LDSMLLFFSHHSSIRLCASLACVDYPLAPLMVRLCSLGYEDHLKSFGDEYQ